MEDVAVIPDHPHPWRIVEHGSCIIIRDANVGTVLMIPFSGASSRERKRRVAEWVLQAAKAPSRINIEC